MYESNHFETLNTNSALIQFNANREAEFANDKDEYVFLTQLDPDLVGGFSRGKECHKRHSTLVTTLRA